MNGVTLNTRTDEDIMEFPQVDFEIEAVIHCTPWFTVPPLPLLVILLTNCEVHFRSQRYQKLFNTGNFIILKTES